MHFEDFTRLEAGTAREALDLRESRSDVELVEDVMIHGHEVGEGTVVQLVAKILTAHISDCRKPKAGEKGGEAVNCSTLGMASNDIHIVLMPLDANEHTSECESVTAEMISHFRPATWSELDLKTPVNPVRITGQLFYDNSHTPCKEGKGSPARRTVWEIHPTYQLDVCKNASESGCSQTDTSAWVAYDQWVKQPGAVTHATGKKQRSACESAATHH